MSEEITEELKPVMRAIAALAVQLGSRLEALENRTTPLSGTLGQIRDSQMRVEEEMQKLRLEVSKLRVFMFENSASTSKQLADYEQRLSVLEQENRKAS